METLIYLLTVGLLAVTAISFKLFDTLSKEIAALKEKVQD